MIQPRTLKGFRDLTPEQAFRRATLVRTLEDVFRRHGYAPIDTPAMEYAEILKGKGGEDSDKELFEWTDKGKRQVALRFDLTVPLARYVAQHQGGLTFPFRRYHMGPVWRGERPQRGRFREFWQCDADIIGPESDSADAEILVLMADAYAALDVGAVTLRVNDRRVLTGLLEKLGAAELSVTVLRALDKREKQGDEVAAREMVTAGLADDAAARLLEVTAPQADDEATLALLAEAVAGNERGEAGVAGLRRVRELFLTAGRTEAEIRIDPGIARGLDYYTGIVLEAQLNALPDIGSVGSGGRYDDLAGLYTKTRLPGVGCSVGIDRLLAALEELAPGGQTASPDVMVVNPGPERLAQAFAFAAALRAGGVSAEVYPAASKHKAQMRYADKRGIRFAITPDEDGSFFGKALATGEARSCANVDAALAWITAS